MNVEQCKALGLIPYAVYGGKVESFKLRETQPDAYGDPMLLIVLDRLIENTNAKAHEELIAERGRHLALWSSVAGVVRRLLPEVEGFNSETAVKELHKLVDEMQEVNEYLNSLKLPEGPLVSKLSLIEAEGAKERKCEVQIVATPFDLCSGACGHYWRAGDGPWSTCPVCAELNVLRERAEAAERERDALRNQIAAGEPFDSDEIEKIGNDLSEASKSALMSWTMVGDPRARHGSDKLLPPVTPKPGADLGRFNCAGDYVFQVPRNVLVESLCDTCTLRDQPCSTRVDQGPIVSCGMYDAKQELPRFENGGEWVEQLVGAIGPLFSKRCCNTCQREKSSCPFHVSGPMFGCASWVQRKEQKLMQREIRVIGDELAVEGQVVGVLKPGLAATLRDYVEKTLDGVLVDDQYNDGPVQKLREAEDRIEDVEYAFGRLASWARGRLRIARLRVREMNETCGQWAAAYNGVVAERDQARQYAEGLLREMRIAAEDDDESANAAHAEIKRLTRERDEARAWAEDAVKQAYAQGREEGARLGIGWR